MLDWSHSNNAVSDLSLFFLVTSPQDLFSSTLLGRSPSPLTMQAQQRRSPPLEFGALKMQRVPHQVMPPYQSRPQPSGIPHRTNQQPVRKPQERHPLPGGPAGQRSHTAAHPQAVSSQSSSPFITDRSFMPTSVMRKIQQDRMDQKTPKTDEKVQALGYQSKERSTSQQDKTTVNRKDFAAPGTLLKQPSMDQESSELMAQSRPEAAGDFLKGVLLQKYMDERQAPTQTSAIKQDNLLSPRSMMSGEVEFSQGGSPVLQKPTAFKPLPGSPQLPFSSLNSGIHSEPTTPLHSFNQGAGSPLKPVLPNSAPCTPQRHPLVDKAALLSPHHLVSTGRMARGDSNKPTVGLFGQNISLESQAKGARSGITKVVAANEGRPLTHSYEQHAHVSPEKVSAMYDDTFHAKRSESLSGIHPISQHNPNTMGVQRMVSSDMTVSQEGLSANHPTHRIHGGETRPTPVHHTPRPYHGSHGPRPRPHLPNGRLSPSGMPAMHRNPGRTPFNSPMAGMAMPPRSAILPGMMAPNVHPAYLRMMSSAGSPIGMPSPGMSPVSMRMQMPRSSGRYPVMPGHHHPPMMFAGRPSPSYPPVNPAAAVAASMMGTRSPHIIPHSGLQQGQGRRGELLLWFVSWGVKLC